jgi:hypothetical protein
VQGSNEAEYIIKALQEALTATSLPVLCPAHTWLLLMFAVAAANAGATLVPLQATCSDANLDSDGQQPYDCPDGYDPKPGSAMATPPGDNTCCVVSLSAIIAAATLSAKRLNPALQITSVTGLACWHSIAYHAGDAYTFRASGCHAALCTHHL